MREYRPPGSVRGAPGNWRPYLDKPAPPVQAYDIMGNSLSLKDSVLEESPVYLVGKSAEAVLASVSR
jgi:hypothetical protein